jgi:P27 family predicted phage terminase small subunit
MPGVKGRSGGRNKVPTNLALIRGNPGKRPLNQREPKPSEGTPDKPDWLTGEASDEWDRVVPQLRQLKLLSIIDKATLTGYCLAWGVIRETTEDIERNGLTLLVIEKELEDGTRLYASAKVNPAATRREKALADLRAFSAQYGFSPSDRARMTTPEVPDVQGAERLLSS